MGEDPLFTIKEAATALRIGRSSLYLEVRDGRLRITKVRGSSFVLGSEIERYKHQRDRKRAA